MGVGVEVVRGCLQVAAEWLECGRQQQLSRWRPDAAGSASAGLGHRPQPSHNISFLSPPMPPPLHSPRTARTRTTSFPSCWAAATRRVRLLPQGCSGRSGLGQRGSAPGLCFASTRVRVLLMAFLFRQRR